MSETITRKELLQKLQKAALEAVKQLKAAKATMVDLQSLANATGYEVNEITGEINPF